MILATALVFLFGVFLGWLYGQRSRRNELTELRRLRQIDRLDTRHQKRQSNALESSEPKATNGKTENTVLKHARTSPPASGLSTANSTVSVKTDTSELDDLYRISARVKPLEYDLTQRKIEVKALKQALQDVRRINEKQLVSVRLQAENKSSLQYKEKLADKQNQIDSLNAKLSDAANLTSSSKTLQQQNEQAQAQALELVSIKQQLAGTLENLTQSERRVAEVQKTVSGLNQQLSFRSSELEAVQLSLKEAVEREVILAGRLKSLNAQSRRVGVMSGEIEARDRSVNIMSAQLNEHRDLITDLRTELRAKCEQIDVQKKRLQQIPLLEENASKIEQEQIHVQEQAHVRERELVELVETLQRALNEKDKHITNLRKQSDRVISLESAAKSREVEIRTLIQRIANAEKLEEQIVEKDRRIVSLQQIETKVADQDTIISNLKSNFDSVVSEKKLLENRQLQLHQELTLANESVSELSRIRTKLANSKEVEEQLANVREKLAKAQYIKADLDRLESVSNELEQSRVEIKSLNQSLETAQLASSTVRENDIEMRRLRSEMQSLQAIHDSSVNKVHSLEKQIQQQEHDIATNVQLKERVQELESVQVEAEHRDQQIAELKIRLRELSNNSSSNNVVSKKQARKSKSGTLPKPLYTVPAEKDDLKKINGIGPVMEKMLNSLGVTSFKQIAEFKIDDIRTVTAAIEAFPGRIERDNWVGGAKEQYAKKYRKADA